MKKIFTLLLLSCVLSLQAQSLLKIDINNSGRSVAEGTADGFTPWTFGRVASATETFAGSNGESITITISSVQRNCGCYPLYPPPS